MKKENEISLWQHEFSMYAHGNRRISIIASYIQKSNAINSILDIGCNKCLIGALNPNINYYGVDWILTEESKKFNTLSYDINSREDLPFAINFDAIAMSGILEYAKDPYSLLEHVATRLNTGGLLFLSYVNFNYITRILRKSINRKTYLHPTWKNTLDFQLLRSMFEHSNLDIVQEMSVDLPLSRFSIHKLIGEKAFEMDWGDSLSKQKLFILKKS